MPTNWTATSWADVAAKHTLALDGDTITVNPGSYTVTAPTVITKYVKIIAGGVVTLTDNVAGTSNLLTITESTVGNTRFEGFTIIQGSGAHVNPYGVVVVSYQLGGKPVLIAGNAYTIPSGYVGDFIIVNTNRGVIWNNMMTAHCSGGVCDNQSAFVRHGNDGLIGPWTEVPYYGMADTNGDKCLYIEHNEIYDCIHGIDSFANARTVIRYNKISNSQIENHGAETGVGISARSLEIYNNELVWDQADKCGAGIPTGVSIIIWLRGGPALIHDNIIPNFISGVWGNPSEVKFTDLKLRRNAGPWACWNSGYPSPYQVGWGWNGGGTQAGTSGVFMDLEPVYLWNNTGGGDYGAPSVPDLEAECGGSAPSVATYVQVNREYYLNTAKPSYTPYIYPHPLAVAETPPTGGETLMGACLND